MRAHWTIALFLFTAMAVLTSLSEAPLLIPAFMPRPPPLRREAPPPRDVARPPVRLAAAVAEAARRRFSGRRRA